MKFNLNFVKDFKDLATRLMDGLGKLSLEDNFLSFKEQSVTIKSSEYVTIQNKLTFVPDSYIIVKQKGNGIITHHTPVIGGIVRQWDKNFLYLYNNGPDEVTIDIVFMR